MGIYELNEIMKMLGKQYPMQIFTEKSWGEMREVVKARRFSDPMDMAWDVFMLGYIYGKRSERSKHKKKQ